MTMNVSWVLSDKIAADFADPAVLKNVAPLWGAASTWKSYKTDNTVCSELSECKQLVERAFHAVSNFHVPKSFYADLGRPVGLKLFEGEFKTPDMKGKDDVVALNLAAPNSDIVLMLGFELRPTYNIEYPLERVAVETYQNNLRAVMEENETTQFVLVNYAGELSKMFANQDNLTIDTLQSVLDLLV